MFLVDGIGAMLSALGLLFLLIPFQSFFGMPEVVCRYLALIAFAFTAYSLMRYFSDMNNWRTYLKIIAVANSIYCLLTIFLLIYHYGSLTLVGLCYFIAEILIIVAIVRLEVLTLKKSAAQ